jgi:addiction module HigA family antidote
MPRPAVHPGKVLADELAAIGVSPTALARQIDVPPNRISQIIHSKRAITGDTALRLAHWFGTTPEFWLNLQTAHDLHIAEQACGSTIRALPTRPAKLRSPRSDALPRKHNRAG